MTVVSPSRPVGGFRSFDDLILESVVGFGLFRSYLVGASFDNLMAERIRQTYSHALKRLQHARSLDLETPVLDIALGRLKNFVFRLDSNILIGRELSEAYLLVSDRDRREAFLGFPPELPSFHFDCPVMRRALQAGLRSRANELKFRIEEELNRPGVFAVFNTLTTDPLYDYIYEPGCDLLKLWFRKVARVFGEFRYCSVLERGPEGKLHFHVLMIFEECRFADPNRSRALCDHEEVNELKRLWPYGFSTPIAVRYGPNDVYGCLGWKWPRRRKTGAPAAVACYMAKYVTKSTVKELNGCRTRMSRGFGLRRLVQIKDRARDTILTLGQPAWVNTIKWSRRPPRRLLLRLAFRAICDQRCLRPLPPMSIGSVCAASAILRTGVYSPMSVGSSPFPRDDSRCLDPFRSQGRRCSIGEMT